MTVKVTAAIYWNALLLKLKGCPFYSHPKHLKKPMTEAAQEQVSDFSTSDPAKAGFFEKVLCRQLRLCEAGSLVMKTPSTQMSFGGSGKTEMQADLEINRNSFFRKACLGGSLGVADSYADGDWDTSDLVKFFRFFLQNQK